MFVGWGVSRGCDWCSAVGCHPSLSGYWDLGRSVHKTDWQKYHHPHQEITGKCWIADQPGSTGCELNGIAFCEPHVFMNSCSVYKAPNNFLTQVYFLSIGIWYRPKETTPTHVYQKYLSPVVFFSKQVFNELFLLQSTFVGCHDLFLSLSFKPFKIHILCLA